MFCLRFASLCLLLAVAINVSNGVHLNAENLMKVTDAEDISENEYGLMNFDKKLNIETIAEDTFKKCVNLRQFFLVDNPVSKIPKNLFKYNKNITSLVISNSQITTLHPDTFAAQANIEALTIHKNYLPEIDEGLFRHNINLIALSLSSNQLIEIQPNTFATLVRLKNIVLDNNRLTSLPENLFAHNPKLVGIYLSSNRFKVLPANLFKNKMNLEIVHLSHNRFSSFDLNVFLTNPQLNILWLHNNDLTEIVSFDKLNKYWPKFLEISLTGNNFKCSYLRSIYNYCLEHNFNVYTKKYYLAKHPEELLFDGHSCIEDKDFETVNAARINVPDAEYVQKNYTVAFLINEKNHTFRKLL